ncbi:EAL domain-containing protein [Acidimangrovimonas pyrenivorans]|uniref:EAL domain-containing protein n=1 Tax=Acidimangrovimonas pyrenivorans TaxID=2030798 RepID=A0ABV7ALR8_9RHOB
MHLAAYPGTALPDDDAEGPPRTGATVTGPAAEETLAMVRRALDGGRVLLAYQPVVMTRDTGRLAFCEGLIRLLDDAGQVIPAARFIEVAERSEMGRILDCLALELGLAALAADPALRLAVNMSARTIGYPRWSRSLTRAVDRDPTLAERLIIEITETSALRHRDSVVLFMDGLQRRGIAFAIDDFGAGFTAISHFRAFYFDVLKIDGQFIRGIHRDPDNQVLTRAMVSIARHFDMFTVAEYVEDMRDADYLSGLGVDCLQGYLFGAPTPRPPGRGGPVPPAPPAAA